MKYKLIVMVMCTLLIINLVSATSFTFKQNEDVNYRFRCLTITGDYCTSGTILVISVEYDLNGSNILNNVSMTFNETFFNITLPTHTTGTYKGIISSTTSNNTVSEFTYEVNPLGIESTEQRSEALTRSLYFIFGIAILLFIAFLIKTSPPIKWTFFIFSIIFLLIGFNIISISLADEVVNPKLASFFDRFTAITFFFYFFAAGLLIIMWFFTFLNEWIFQRNLRNARRYGIA